VKSKRSLQLHVVESSEDFYLLKDSWNEILQKLPECPPFLTWEWMYTWWEVYNTKSTSLLILKISDIGKTVAILPLYIRKRVFPLPHSKVYFIGTGEPESKEVFSEYLDIISLPEYADAASYEIASYFDSKDKLWDCLGFHRILENACLMRFFLKHMVDRKFHGIKKHCGKRYFIKLPDQWEKYNQSLKASMRRSIRVAHKKLEEDKSNYQYQIIDKEKDIDSAMNDLARLHSESWQSKSKPGAFTSREFNEFHRKVAKLLNKKNMLYMLRIRIADEVVAVLYNYNVSDSCYYYQSGLNMKKFSFLKPGVLMHSEAIKDAIDKGMATYDFMMAGERSYKSQYGCETSDMFHIDVWNKGLKSLFMRKLALLPYFRNVK
jgi:CelD/BcsL family acetyltransferase involved in cellulose biosynthesis